MIFHESGKSQAFVRIRRRRPAAGEKCWAFVGHYFDQNRASKKFNAQSGIGHCMPAGAGNMPDLDRLLRRLQSSITAF